MKKFSGTLLTIFTTFLATSIFAAGAPVSHQFQGGQPASASQVNENFQELADRIADIPETTTYDYHTYLSTVASKTYSVSSSAASCGDAETWNYSRTANGDSTNVAVTAVVTDASSVIPCSRYIRYFTAGPDQYVQTGYDTINPDTLAVVASRRYEPARTSALASMTPGHQYSFYYELFSTPTGGSETSSGLYLYDMTAITLENVTVPAGSFSGCLKIRGNSYNGPHISRSIVWRCPVVGEVKRIQFSVVHPQVIDSPPEDSQIIRELTGYTP